jgi:hypothetical protein
MTQRHTVKSCPSCSNHQKWRGLASVVGQFLCITGFRSRYSQSGTTRARCTAETGGQPFLCSVGLHERRLRRSRSVQRSPAAACSPKRPGSSSMPWGQRALSSQPKHRFQVPFSRKQAWRWSFRGALFLVLHALLPRCNGLLVPPPAPSERAYTTSPPAVAVHHPAP